MRNPIAYLIEAFTLSSSLQSLFININKPTFTNKEINASAALKVRTAKMVKLVDNVKSVPFKTFMKECRIGSYITSSERIIEDEDNNAYDFSYASELVNKKKGSK